MNKLAAGTLYMHPTGPLMKYSDGTLVISDLNPEIETRWKMTRGEMFFLGLRCVGASLNLRQRLTKPK